MPIISSKLIELQNSKYFSLGNSWINAVHYKMIREKKIHLEHVIKHHRFVSAVYYTYTLWKCKRIEPSVYVRLLLRRHKLFHYYYTHTTATIQPTTIHSSTENSCLVPRLQSFLHMLIRHKNQRGLFEKRKITINKISCYFPNYPHTNTNKPTKKKK